MNHNYLDALFSSSLIFKIVSRAFELSLATSYSFNKSY